MVDNEIKEKIGRIESTIERLETLARDLGPAELVAYVEPLIEPMRDLVDWLDGQED